MAIRHIIMFQLIILLVTISLSLGEIHRAKSYTPKTNVRSGKEDYVATSNSVKRDILEAGEESYNKMNVEVSDSKYETWLFSILASMLVGLSGIFPLLVIPLETGPNLKHGAAASHLKLLLSFAVGGLLGDVFLHLLPEAWDHLGKDGHNHEDHTRLGLWVITGMLSFLIIEKVFAKEDEFEHLQDECAEAIEEEQQGLDHVDNNHTSSQKYTHKHTANAKHRTNIKHSDKKQNGATSIKKNKSKNSKAAKSKNNSSDNKEQSIKVSGYLNLTANVIDNFTHGLAVAGGFLVSTKVGFITTLAILLHEIPHEVGDFAILLRSGFDRWKAAKAQLLTATGGMVGALTALTADSAQAAGDFTAWILPFTSGGFIYIALVTVVPDLLEEKHPRESTKQVLCLLAGVAAMYLVTIIA